MIKRLDYLTTNLSVDSLDVILTATPQKARCVERRLVWARGTTRIVNKFEPGVNVGVNTIYWLSKIRIARAACNIAGRSSAIAARYRQAGADIDQPNLPVTLGYILDTIECTAPGDRWRIFGGQRRGIHSANGPGCLRLEWGLIRCSMRSGDRQPYCG